ncbi:hypothetical protein CONPUDRAFT_100999 [Coniophora puteana RWD-64-598 SS2]|uniref:Non-structural maintenance of chromosomes element 4 n=1 Tax=Coniophora puteana (strain RWD-64-598) TaxID=741705 RepID=A0A5M3MU54_CONPW|nr:uncharacterized protein CONPUDRAFT_100999 [Coniophora puteana RWD-64-598 SS2]EIW82702.1 hypothetical protein CONPUDRAFT_100999 [Coniophora puteana RWD-64-598 SS2]
MDVDRAQSLAYDPDQDAAEKRDIRKQYRVLERLTDNGGRPQDYTAKDLVDQVTRADSLFSKVRNPTEATLDSSVLRNVSAISAQKARAMRLGSGAFDLDDFVSKLVSFMGGRRHVAADDDDEEEFVEDDDSVPLDWDRIGRRALAKSRRVPVSGFMLGPLSVEQKKRGPIKRARLEKEAEEEKKPQAITEEDIQRSENETSKNVAAVRPAFPFSFTHSTSHSNTLNNDQILERLLAIGEPVNFFRFVINPNDFAQSVENIFYLSFSIRDAAVALQWDEDGSGEPILMACQEPTDEDRAAGVRKQQVVMEFDMATWRRAIEVFNITEAMIPTRAAARTGIKGKWYG